MNLRERLSNFSFKLVHQHNLVYNTCWEDPRLDRQALALRPSDVVVMITSAGCNALDYALLKPGVIHAVDMNPRQNALLELKIAGIRELEYGDFFQIFGHGYFKPIHKVYHQTLRRRLSLASRGYWDRHILAFANERRPSFYFHGSSGLLAWMINFYIDWVAKVRDAILGLLGARSLDAQKAIYTRDLHGAFWTRFMRWAVDRDATLSLLGVPRAQREQVERAYPGGIARFIEDRIETVFTRLPFHDNYFWRVYLTGRYSPDCCPEYLREEGFHQLKEGRVDNIVVHTRSLLDFFQRFRGKASRFIFLDHMDWMSSHARPALQQQWQAVLDKATPDARFLWRSGGLSVDYVDPIEVTVERKKRRLGDLLQYDHALSSQLHERDRVHTYGSFYIADRKVGA